MFKTTLIRRSGSDWIRRQMITTIKHQMPYHFISQLSTPVGLDWNGFDPIWSGFYTHSINACGPKIALCVHAFKSYLFLLAARDLFCKSLNNKNNKKKTNSLEISPSVVLLEETDPYPNKPLTEAILSTTYLSSCYHNKCDQK